MAFDLIYTFAIALTAALLVALALVWTRRWHDAFSADHAGTGPQKVHEGAIPRVGGAAIMVGFAGSLLLSKVGSPTGNAISAPAWLVLALFVPFAIGLLEDTTKSFGPVSRLVATAIGASIAYFFCDAIVARLDVPWLDGLLALHPLITFCCTLFCVAGIAHAFNLADGLNGLLSGLGMVAACGIAFAAHSVSDDFLLIAAVALLGSIAGFALLNFPRAQLFAGDGGAYLVGAAVAILGTLFVHRHAEISPWFAFALVLYPFVDTTYAIFRRWRQGRPIMSPDAEHLHSLLGQKLSQAHPSRGRNIASVLIVVASAAFTCVATRWMTNTVVLVALSATYFVGYVVCHRHLANPATAARFQGNHESAD